MILLNAYIVVWAPDFLIIIDIMHLSEGILFYKSAQVDHKKFLGAYQAMEVVVNKWDNNIIPINELGSICEVLAAEYQFFLSSTDVQPCKISLATPYAYRACVTHPAAIPSKPRQLLEREAPYILCVHPRCVFARM